MRIKYSILTIALLSVIIMVRADVTPPMGVVNGDFNTYEVVSFVTDGNTPGLEIYDQDKNNSTYLTAGDIFTIEVINATVGREKICNTNGDCFYIPDVIEIEIQFNDYHQRSKNQVYGGYIITTDIEFIDNYYSDNNYPGNINITETEDTVTIMDSFTIEEEEISYEIEVIYDKQTGWMLEVKFSNTMDGETISAEMRSIGSEPDLFGILQFELPIFVLAGLSIVMLKRFRHK